MKKLTTAEASQFLIEQGFRFTAATLMRYRGTRRGPAFLKVGGRVFYTPADLTAWIDARTQRCTATADYRGSREGACVSHT